MALKKYAVALKLNEYVINTTWKQTCPFTLSKTKNIFQLGVEEAPKGSENIIIQ